MQRLGCVLHISSSGSAILKAENIPRIGDKVVDERMKTVGTVFDVFGSVSSPYVSIRTKIKDSSRLVGCVVHAIPYSNFRKRRREKR